MEEPKKEFDGNDLLGVVVAIISVVLVVWGLINIF